MKKLLCPKCRSGRIEMYAGFVTGSYLCKKCGYLGPLIEEISAKRKSAKKTPHKSYA